MSRASNRVAVLTMLVLTLVTIACGQLPNDVTWKTCTTGQTSGCGAKYGSSWNVCAVEPRWFQSCDDMLYSALSTARAEQRTKTQDEPRVEGQLADACVRAEAAATAQVAKFHDTNGVGFVKYCLTPTPAP